MNMDAPKPKSLKSIEEKMAAVDQGSMRYHVLESARNFKSSWIELGRSLYAVWKDKLYKEWGFSTFEAYSAKEIGIRKQTAMKLLRSYYFLEKEEPHLLKEQLAQDPQPAKVPSYESVDLLRMAKNKKTLDSNDYAHLKNEIFEKGKDVREVKKDLTALIRERKELNPQEAYESRRLSTIKRLVGTLKSLKQEIELSKLLPALLIKEVFSLIKKLEDEIS